MKTNKFEVGEKIESGDITGGVDLEILELLADQGLKVKLTCVDAYWSQRGLRVGDEHVLQYHHEVSRGRWSFADESLPYFNLYIGRGGNKVFVHYR